MEWLSSHGAFILGILLALSECAAAIVQLAAPDNKGVSGILAGIIKFLQGAQPKLPGA